MAKHCDFGALRQIDAAKFIGVTKGTVSKWVKSGILTYPLTKERIIIDLKKAHKKCACNPVEEREEKHEKSLIEDIGEIEVEKLDPARIKVLAKKGAIQKIVEESSHEVKIDEDEETVIDFGEEIDDLDVLGRLKAELAELLSQEDDPSKRAMISKNFWAGKGQEQRYLIESKKLIYTDEVKAILEPFLREISTRIDNLNEDMKARFPEVPIDAISWLSKQINDVKQAMQGYEWEL